METHSASTIDASYSSCQTTALLDIRPWSEDEKNAHKAHDHATVARSPRTGDEAQEAQHITNEMGWNDDRATLVNLDCEYTTDDITST